MALTSSLVLQNVAAANHTFDLVKQNGSETTRLDVATTLAQPVTMLVRHSTIKKGSVTVDRHVVSFRMTKVDATSGLTTDAIVSTSFEVPRTGGISVADVQDLWAYVRNLLPSAAPAANFNELLIGKS